MLPGLEEFAAREARARLPGARVATGPQEGALQLRYDGPLGRLTDLRTVVAVHAVETFSGARPSAMLGDAQFRRLLRLFEDVGPSLAGARTLRLSAAGADTAALGRFAAALCGALRVRPTSGAGDVLVRVRRPPDGSPGWQVLVRLGRRPLSSRSWRVCDMPGALDASIAATMVELADPLPSHRFLNLACGSGTLCVERLRRAPAALVVGVDVAAQALTCASANLRAAGCRAGVALVRADAVRLPFPDGAADEIVADLPFGMVVGLPRDAEALYSGVLAEAARVAAPGATLVAVTARRRLFETAVLDASQWDPVRRVPLRLPTRSRAIRPNIYVLKRR